MLNKEHSILQVNTQDIGGGAEKSAYALFKKYREFGYKSWLAVGRKLGADCDVYEFPKHAPIKNHGSSYNLRKVSVATLTIRRIIEYLRGWEDFNYPSTWNFLDFYPESPSIVHLHNLHGKYFDLRYLPVLSNQAPVILNLRDMWTLTGHCALPINCKRWQIGCGQCPDLKIYPAIARDATKFNYKRKKEIFSRCKLFVTTPTKWLMDQVSVSQMFSAIEYRVIPNAIDTQLFMPGNKELARQALGLPFDTQIVLFLAHNRFKDFTTMREALNYIQKVQTDLLFICIGRNGTNEKANNGQLVYTGRILDEKQMTLYYQAADVYIHAANHEVFGKSIVEAMACATPVVVTAVDGIPEVVNDGTTGFLTPAKDPLAMAERINFLLKNPGLRQKMGMQSTIYAKNAFNLDRQADDFLFWYQEILQRR